MDDDDDDDDTDNSDTRRKTSLLFSIDLELTSQLYFKSSQVVSLNSSRINYINWPQQLTPKWIQLMGHWTEGVGVQILIYGPFTITAS